MYSALYSVFILSARIQRGMRYIASGISGKMKQIPALDKHYEIVKTFEPIAPGNIRCYIRLRHPNGFNKKNVH